LFSMAANGDMPRVFYHVHSRYKVPDRAELAVAACVALVVLFVDVRSAIGFSSFGVLFYYGIANACAFTLNATERRSPRVLAIAGVLGCVVLALSLPWESIAVGSAVVMAGALAYTVRRRLR